MTNTPPGEHIVKAILEGKPDNWKDQHVFVFAWECHSCDVSGRGIKEARCWNCGRYAMVIARPWIHKDFVDEFIR